MSTLKHVATAILPCAVMPLRAELISFTANLSGANEVPPNGSTGSGEMLMTYYTVAFDLQLTIAGISLGDLSEAAGPNDTSV